MKKKKINIRIVNCRLKKSFIEGPSVLFTFTTDNGRLHSWRVPYYNIVLCNDENSVDDSTQLLRGFVNNIFYLSFYDSVHLLDLLKGRKENKTKFPNIFNFLGM